MWKNLLEDAGELIIIERPGYTNLYFVAWQGQPVGGSYRAAPGSTHEPGCPLRRGMPEVSGVSDTQGSGASDTPCQEGLTHKTKDNDIENEARSLSPGNGPAGPGLTPTDLKRVGLTPGSVVWRALVEGHEGGAP
jgi:hypothetical protein